MNSLTILYAEDEKQTRLNYTNYLKIYFKEVYSVENGEDALKSYEKNSPDILLLDINMPKINGLEVAKKIRKTDKISRIIILTAHLERDKLLFAAELNLTKYLPKPTTRSQLKSALQEAILQLKELTNNTKTVNFGENFIWDKTNKILKHELMPLKLTKHEILFLDLLSSKESQIFSLDDIALDLWNDIYSSEINTRKIKDIIKRLRKKLPSNAIENIYGAGYKLNII